MHFEFDKKNINKTLNLGSEPYFFICSEENYALRTQRQRLTKRSSKLVLYVLLNFIEDKDTTFLDSKHKLQNL